MARICFLAAILSSIQFVPLQAETRSWSDSTGRFKREGEFVKLDANKVVLRDKDGKTVPIPFDRLCTIDQDYVVVVSRQRGGDPKAVVRERTAGGRWALLVGVNKYQNLSSLNYATRDMQQLKAKLLNLGFPENQIVLLSDAATDTDNLPTKKNIDAWLERLLAGRILTSQARGTIVEPRLVGQADQIVVAFSGHGVQLSGESYFCPGEADVKKTTETMVSMRNVYARLASVTTGLRFLLVDACRNSLGDSPDQPKALEIDRAQLPVGIVALSSCSAGQTSLEDQQIGQGVFSYFLQAGLGGAAGTPDASGNVEVRLNQLATFVIDKTESYAQSILDGKQTPHLVASIEGNPLLGIVPKDRVVRSDQLASTRRTSHSTTGYAINLHSVTTPDLPEGWTGPGGLVTADVAGRRVLRTNADKPVVATSPPIKIQGDFYIELEVGHAEGEQPFGLKLLGDNGERDLDVQFQLSGAYWYFTLPELARKNAEAPLDKVIRAIPTRVRLERRGTQYIVSFQCDKTREFAYRYDAYKDFKGLEITLPPSGIVIYDLHVGPLNSKAPTGVTTEYKPTIPRDRLPEGWWLAGQPLNGAARIVGPSDKIDIRGDFYFAMRAATDDSTIFTIALHGRDGKRSLPLTVSLNGGYLYASLPQTEQTGYLVRDYRNGFTLRLERRDGAIALVVNSEEVKQVLHEDSMCDFDGLQFDIWQGKCAISQMALGPLGVATEPAERP